MGLYLCVFEADKEIDGVDVGSYADFNHLRSIVAGIEDGPAGSTYPTFILHSDCDGEWNVEQCEQLENELQAIEAKFRRLPPVDFSSDWQREVASELGLCPQNLYESFIDADGRPLLERLRTLCRLSLMRGIPIIFQ